VKFSLSQVSFIEVSEKTSVITIPVKGPNDWIKLNSGQSGCFRVQYSPNLLQRLVAGLSTLSSIDKLGLVNDLFALALSGSSPLSQALEFVQHFKDEQNPIVWSTIIDNLITTLDLFSGVDETITYLNKFILDLCGNITQKVGWDVAQGEDDLIKSLRPRLLSLMGDNGDAAVVEEAKLKFSLLQKDTSSLPADLSMVAFKFFVKSGGEAEHAAMIDLYHTFQNSTTLSPEYVIKALTGVGMVKTPELISKTLDFILTSDTVRSQDFFYPWFAICSTTQGKEAAWKFLREKWDAINEKVADSLLIHTIKGCTGFNTLDKVTEIENFFNPIMKDSFRRVVNGRIEFVKTQSQSLTQHKDSTHKWFVENVKL